MIDYLAATLGLLTMAGLSTILFFGGDELAWLAFIGGGLGFILSIALTIYLKTTKGTP